MRAAAAMVWVLLWPNVVTAASIPSIDGFMDDEFWPVHGRSWHLQDERISENVARFHLGYDNEYLYFAFDVDDANLVGRNKGRKVPAWEDDGVKLLLHFGDAAAPAWSAETFSYTFSALGGMNWARGPADIASDQVTDPGWPVGWNSGIYWASRLKAGTTPNLTGDHDAGYVIEGRIPWSEFPSQPPFPPGHTINICLLNLCRPEMTEPEGQPVSSMPGVHALIPREPGRWQRLRMNWNGPLAMRGLIEPLPLPAANAEAEWETFRSTSTDATGPWLNRSVWAEKLKRMRSRNLNTLLLAHPDPLASLLPAADTPGLAKQSPEVMKNTVDQFVWILSEATRSGVRVYLRPTSPGQHTHQQYSDLFATYADLAGLCIAPGRLSSSPTAVVADPVIHGLNDSLARRSAEAGVVPPELLLDPYNCPPQEVRTILDAYPHFRLLHSLRDGDWVGPTIDPKVARHAAAVDVLARNLGEAPVSVVAAGRIGGPSKYLLWSDPERMRNLTLDLRRNGIEGLLLELDIADPSLAEDALGDYSYNAGEQYSPQRWLMHLRERYGVEEYAGQLLETMQQASTIVPTFITLVHDDSPRYMPQFGLPLTHYLELPTISNRRGGEPLEATSAGWGGLVAPIRADIANTAPAGSRRPYQIVSDLRQAVDTCRSRLPALRHLEIKDAARARELTVLLDRLELNVALGEHFQYKIEAAMAWEQFQARQARGLDCLRPLDQSVAAWRQVVELAERVYPKAIPYWQSRMVSVPPWSDAQLDRGYRLVTGHWRDQLSRFEREATVIRVNVGNLGRDAYLPSWDHIESLPADQLIPVRRLDFEEGDAGCVLFDGASLTVDEKLIIMGKQSLLITSPDALQGPHVALRTNAAFVPLRGGASYQISFGYRVVDNDETPDKPAESIDPFEIGIQPADGGEWVAQPRTWSAPKGYAGLRVLNVSLPEGGPYAFCIAVHNKARLVVDPIDFFEIPAPAVPRPLSAGQ